MENVNKFSKGLIGINLLPFHPLHGYYIEMNGYRFYENENKRQYDLAVKCYFELLEKLKNM